MVEGWLTRCFGYHAAFLGLRPELSGDVRGLRIPHGFSLGVRSGDVLGQADALPLAAESLDLVILHHVLEYASDPHQVLREADRVLVPEGHLLLMSFNPMGAWGLRGWFNPSRTAPWYGHRLGRGRLNDWLGLLGYDIQAEGWAGHGWLSRRSVSGDVLLGRATARFLPGLGMTYMLLARKRVSMPAPIRHRWNLMPVLGGVRATVQNRVGNDS